MFPDGTIVTLRSTHTLVGRCEEWVGVVSHVCDNQTVVVHIHLYDGWEPSERCVVYQDLDLGLDLFLLHARMYKDFVSKHNWTGVQTHVTPTHEFPERFQEYVNLIQGLQK